MGLYERDYYQDAARPRGIQLGSVVTILIALNVFLWLLQVFFINARVKPDDFLACRPDDVFLRFYLWQILTANFLHDPKGISHLLGNMLFLFFFGRELEAIYGRRRFLAFYLTAGCLAILGEAAICHFFTDRGDSTLILGASGGVMGTVVLYALLFPTQKIYLALIMPIDAWLLCIIFILLDISGVLSGGSGVANWAHLTGAAYGLLYRILSFPGTSWGGKAADLFRSLRWRLKAKRRPRLLPPEERTHETPRAREDRPARDPVSVRIDELLEKISKGGRGSLSKEEIEFLMENSKKYRSER